MRLRIPLPRSDRIEQNGAPAVSREGLVGFACISVLEDVLAMHYKSRGQPDTFSPLLMISRSCAPASMSKQCVALVRAIPGPCSSMIRSMLLHGSPPLMQQSCPSRHRSSDGSGPEGRQIDFCFNDSIMFV
jgi:hypothetical protein